MPLARPSNFVCQTDEVYFRPLCQSDFHPIFMKTVFRLTNSKITNFVKQFDEILFSL